MKYLKPYWASILAVVVLLFVQANFDLALPDYMSRIVNYGIQQGGIDSPLPRILSEGTFKELAHLLNKEDEDRIARAYIPLPSANITAVPMKAAAQSPVFTQVYQLVPLSKMELTELERVLSRALAMQALPPQALEQFSKSLDAMGDKALEQMAIARIHKEYEHLGVNLEQLQMSYIVRYGLIMILMTLGSMASVILVGFLASRTATGAAKQLRRDHCCPVNFKILENLAG